MGHGQSTELRNVIGFFFYFFFPVLGGCEFLIFDWERWVFFSLYDKEGGKRRNFGFSFSCNPLSFVIFNLLILLLLLVHDAHLGWVGAAACWMFVGRKVENLFSPGCGFCGF